MCLCRVVEPSGQAGMALPGIGQLLADAQDVVRTLQQRQQGVSHPVQIRDGRHDREVGGGHVGRVAHDDETVRGATK